MGCLASDDEDVSVNSGSSESSDHDIAEMCSDPKLLAVLIHEVLPEDKALAHMPPKSRGPQWRERLRRRRVFFHKTYIGAALALHECSPQFVTTDDLEIVAKEA